MTSTPLAQVRARVASTLLTAFGLLFCAALLPSSGFAQTKARVVGPEPGEQFANASTSQCDYGEYQRGPTSSFGGSCSNLLKELDIFPTIYSPDQSVQSIPVGLLSTYAIQVIWNGGTYNAYGAYLGDSTGLNIADPNFQNYYWGTYVPTVAIPNYQTQTGTTVTLTNPMYLSADAWFELYSTFGANVSGTKQTPVTWAPGYPQNATAWAQGWQAFITAAKTLAPKVRLSPHIASQDPYVWSNFQTIYQDCPAAEKEHFPLSEPVSDGSHRYNVYNQILGFYWLANVAPPVFPNVSTEPPTRVTQWGTDINPASSTDLHTALGIYALSRGPNSFFDLLNGANSTVNPALWLPIANQLGTSTSGPTVIQTGSGQAASSGYNVLQRNWTGGSAFYNMSGATVTITGQLPSGAKSFNCTTGGCTYSSISSLTLADGQGDVILGVGAANLPSISSFTATPSGIAPGGTSTLAWATQNATTLKIDQGVGVVTGHTSASVSPTANTTYTLTASDAAGHLVAQQVTVSVSVPGAPVISSFSARPGTIAPAGSSTLSWTVSAATGSLTIDNGVGDVSGHTSTSGGIGTGSIAVTPSATTRYTLTACNAIGCTPQSTTVTVSSGGGGGGGGAGSHAYWRVRATCLNSGDCGPFPPGDAEAVAELALRSSTGGTNLATGGTGISDNTGFCCTIGSAFDSNPATYWGTGDLNGLSSAYIGYHLATAANIVEFALTNRNDIFWAQQSPTSMTLDSSDDGSTWATACPFSVPATGQPGAWTQGITKTFTCAGTLPVITSFTANPTTITAGAASTLSWSVTGASTLSIDQGVGTVGGTSTSVSPTRDTVYTLTATNGGGSVSQTVTVHVLVAGGGSSPNITSFTATPNSISTGASSQLAWSVSGATTITIDQGVGVVTSLSSVLVNPSVTTVYTLNAANAHGSTLATVTVTINVSGAPPAILSFIATPSSIIAAGTSILSWVTNHDETSLSIDHGVGTVTGTTSVSVSPITTTSYTLTATNTHGSVTAIATVTIVPACSP